MLHPAFLGGLKSIIHTCFTVQTPADVDFNSARHILQHQAHAAQWNGGRRHDSADQQDEPSQKGRGIDRFRKCWMIHHIFFGIYDLSIKCYLSYQYVDVL